MVQCKLSLGSPGRLHGFPKGQKLAFPASTGCWHSKGHSKGHGPLPLSSKPRRAAFSHLSLPLYSARLEVRTCGPWRSQLLGGLEQAGVGDSSESWGQGFGTSFGFSKGTHCVRVSRGGMGREGCHSEMALWEQGESALRLRQVSSARNGT